MSRSKSKNIGTLVALLLLFSFAAYYVLVVGLIAKNKKIALEGAVYAVIFTLVMAVSSGGSSLSGLGGLVVIVSAVRTYMLRDLWLPGRRARPARPIESSETYHPWQVAAPPQQPGFQAAPPEQVYTQPAPPQQLYAQPAAPQPYFSPGAPRQGYVQPGVPSNPAPVQAVRATDGLTAALAWVSSTAKENKYRLPADTYVTVLETCQTLDAVIEAETQQRSGDAAFEYELGALVREYLPAVLKRYLGIPADMVDDKQPNGRTPNEELAEQLQLLSGQADALYASRYGQTSAELSTMGNFLRDRFGHRQKDGFDFGIE